MDEQASVNYTSTEWSYGHRASFPGTSLTPFTPAQHQNGIGHPSVDGWVPGAGVLVNRGSVDATVTLGGETTVPLPPDQILLKPVLGTLPVVRWTAPESGTYNITGRWIDLDTNGGSGAVGHLVVNGTSVMGSAGISWANGGGAEFSPRSFRLLAGDTVDFLVGTGATATADLTGFNAVIRRAPDFTLSAPATVSDGDDLTVTVTPGAGTNLKGVALRVNGVPTVADTEAPFQFILPALSVGQYHLQAEGVDIDQILGASNVLLVTVDDATPSPEESTDEGGSEVLPAESSGSTYDCLASGLWTQADIWRRRSDNGSGIPGPGDTVFINGACQVTLTGNVTVGNVFCEGILQGESTSDHEITVTNHFSMAGGVMRDLTLRIPVGGLITNIRFPSLLQNVQIDCLGDMVISRGWFADDNSQITCGGNLKLLAPPASSAPTILKVNTMTLEGDYLLGPGTGILAEEVLTTATAAGTLSRILAQGLVGPDGGSLVGPDGGSLVGPDGGSLVGPDGATLIGMDGASLIGMDGASVIGQNGANLIGMDGASLIGMDGASLIGPDGASLGRVNTPFVHAALAPLGSTTEMADPEGPQEAAIPGWRLSGGSLRGSGNLFGSVRNAGAVISVGRPNSSGLMRIVGDFTQEAGGKLTLKIGGTTQTPLLYDIFQVTGEATLGGELILDTLNGFVSQSSDNLQPFIYGSRVGSFSRVSANANVSFGPNAMTAEVDGPAPVGGPEVRLSVAPGRIKEGKSAVFTISATPGTPRPLIVGFAMSGKAKLGKDYTISPGGSVVIPVGGDSATVTLKSKKDSAKEKAEGATLTVTPGPGYTPSSPSSATVSILNVKSK